MSVEYGLDGYAWWTALNHGGLLLTASTLGAHFPASIEPLDGGRALRLRRELLKAQSGSSEATADLLDTVLEDVAGLTRQRWLKGSNVPREQSQRSNTGEVLRPARVWQGEKGASLAVFYPESPSNAGPGRTSHRLGTGSGRRSVARVIEWLRKANQRIALLVTHKQLRLIHAGADYEAFCEWDFALWLKEGAPGHQVDALRILLSPNALTPREDGGQAPLLQAITESRNGQSELSAALGERVRRAVELLIQASGPQLLRVIGSSTLPIEERDIYLAATRLILRCVVILFAEAREMLPRHDSNYEKSYGLQALRLELERHSGGLSTERLRTRFGAWPRIVGLFALIYHGSTHGSFTLTRYGGALFLPGNADSDDPIQRVVAALEGSELRDSDVQRILELLTRCPTTLPQGKGWKIVHAPVDFSNLTSEYLGILYEGLLDYELKRASIDEPVLFLGVGNEPALPFKLLNGLGNEDVRELLKKLGKATKAAADDEGEDEEEEEEQADSEIIERADREETENADADDESTTELDISTSVRRNVQEWAERAVKAANLVPPPRRRKGASADGAYDSKVAERAKALVRRLVLPGEWYLVRWGGTRKGSGTFYTRPQLVRPIVRRTLAPLCFGDSPRGEAPQPRKPEEILRLKVCDPAMGSGSFLVAALRYMTDALLQSLYSHGRVQHHGDRWYIRLADGLPLDHPSQESLPLPADSEELDDMLRARLKRHVVERCLYGVDLDPLAVELARTALWLETMDYQLPFGFLDHKLKCGNSLVGTWLDRFEDYPIMAWDREGGDGRHANFVHHRHLHKGKQKGDLWSAAIKTHREERILPLLCSELSQMAAQDAGQAVFAFAAEGKSVDVVHAEALRTFEELHNIIPVFEAERRADLYRTRVLQNPALRTLRSALDTWCAVWFWPGEKVGIAPTPRDFLGPGVEARTEVMRLGRKQRFFHWELEFPDVMTGPKGGFHAVVGNPPWEIQKPNSKEFFSNIDPLYRTYGKQEALLKQKEYFEAAPEVEERWLRYSAHFNALSNWTKNVAFPFGAEGDQGSPLTGVGPVLQDAWRENRSGRTSYTDPEHPFRHQGSADINTYKMFMESAHALLRPGGRLGFLVPSGIYTDNGTLALRKLLLDRCQWTHLYAFQNERYVFEGIHHSFKMAVIHASKASRTPTLCTKFRLGPGDSPESTEIEEDLGDDGRFLLLASERIRQFSPASRAILEVRSQADLTILEKLAANGVPVGDEGAHGWGITYATEFHMSNDSKLFPRRPEWEAKGYKPDEYGHWLKGRWRKLDSRSRKRDWNAVRSADGNELIAVEDVSDVALPLYQGIMVQAFDVAAKGWLSGTGPKAKWEEFETGNARIKPQYLMSLATYRSSEKALERWRVAYRRIARTTDARTWIGAALWPAPSGDSIFHLVPQEESPERSVELAAVCNSFVYDWQLRERLGGTNLSWFVISETLIPRLENVDGLFTVAARLNLNSPLFARVWKPQHLSWRCSWGLTVSERTRLRAILDALVANAYGLTEDDFRRILRECDRPVEALSKSESSRKLEPKGFWRVHREYPPELRHPVLALVAFRELKRIGVRRFLALNEGDGWQLPETLRLADYGFDHEPRAKQHQPVAAALGPRFLPWQLDEDVETSWEECRRHAALLERIVPTQTPSIPPSRDPKQTESAPDLSVSAMSKAAPAAANRKSKRSA